MLQGASAENFSQAMSHNHDHSSIFLPAQQRNLNQIFTLNVSISATLHNFFVVLKAGMQTQIAHARQSMEKQFQDTE